MIFVTIYISIVNFPLFWLYTRPVTISIWLVTLKKMPYNKPHAFQKYQSLKKLTNDNCIFHRLSIHQEALKCVRPSIHEIYIIN